MLRKVKASKGFLTPMFLILLISVSVLVPVQPPSIAQGNSCPGNLVTNGNFTNGAVAGPLGGAGSVSNWTKAYGTPDVGTGAGCQDQGVVGMWGNMNPGIGEGLQQDLGANQLVAGKTYVITFCGRAVLGSGQPTAHFRVRASSSPLTNWGTPNTVGRTTTPIGTTWTPISFTWTAPSGGPYRYLTINVENNLSANDGTKTSYGLVDNFCLTEVIPLDFRPTRACQGQPTPFTSIAAGATSWNWNFGDGSPNSNQQNPAHTYASAGTYNVTLCVNGTTNCVTKPVTVNSAPPAPVITGPSSSCGNQTATYSVPAAGVSYSWNVSNGTINGSSTGNSVNVTWNGTGTGTIAVTVTNKAGCSSSARMEVSSCDVHLGDCCLAFQSKADLKSLVHAGNGVYNFTTTLSTSPASPMIRVTANVISSSLTYSAPSCGTAGPVNSYVVSAGNVPGFVTSIPVTNGHEVIWYGGGTSVSGQAFPIQIKFPPPPTNLHCRDYLTFCVKYTFTDRNCKTCEVIRCYGPFTRGGPIKIDDVKDIKDIQAVP